MSKTSFQYFSFFKKYNSAQFLKRVWRSLLGAVFFIKYNSVQFMLGFGTVYSAWSEIFEIFFKKYKSAQFIKGVLRSLLGTV